MDSNQYEKLAIIFKAMGEVSRLQILDTLLKSPLSVGSVAEQTGLSQANVSKHLKILALAKLVSAERQGNSMIYRVDNPLVKDVCSLCCQWVDQENENLIKSLLQQGDSA